MSMSRKIIKLLSFFKKKRMEIVDLNVGKVTAGSEEHQLQRWRHTVFELGSDRFLELPLAACRWSSAQPIEKESPC